jgi:hypothetical protein
MILFDDIVEAFDLANLDASLGFGIVAFERRITCRAPRLWWQTCTDRSSNFATGFDF